VLFGVGLTVLLAAITYGIQPYGGHPTGWTNPWVLGSITLAVVALVALYFVESRAPAPMLDIRLFRSKPFALGNIAGLMASVGRGGLQFMLIIWLQGIWLPLHGYSFESTPLWSGIYMLPMTIGFLLAGPLSGTLSDRFGSRPFAVGGLVLMAMTFVALTLIPVDFDYRVFAVLIFLNGLGGGMFTAPNTAAIMSSVPAAERGAASGIRATFTNAGMSLSIGIFFSLMIAGLAATLPSTLTGGLTAQGVPHAVAARIGSLPPVGSLFAAFLGYNPIRAVLAPTGVLGHLPASHVALLTGKSFFPQLISQPFHHGLVIVFSTAMGLLLIAAGASALRGGRFIYEEGNGAAPVAAARPATAVPGHAAANGSGGSADGARGSANGAGGSTTARPRDAKASATPEEQGR
jgi:MFS family permease